MSRPRIMTGARVLVYVNGKLYGRAVSFSWSASYGDKEYHGIDVDIPLELITTSTSLKWQMQVLRVVGDGGAQGAGLSPQQVDAHRGKYISIVLVERLSNQVLFKCDYARVNTESWTVVAKDRVLGSLAGSGIAWANEASQ